MKNNLKKNFLEKDKRQLELAVDNTGYVKTPAYWESTLFSEVYLSNDLKRDFEEKWEKDYDDVIFDENGDSVKSGFSHFYNEFRNIASALRNLSDKKLTETDTITKIIAPMLDALGWYDNCQNNVEEPYAAETSFTVKSKNDDKNKTYRTDMLLVSYPQEASYIGMQKDLSIRKKEARQYCIAPLEAKYWNRITDKQGNKKFDKKRQDKKDDDSGSLTFNEQVLNYMEILHKKWGIVSDGNTWRLVHNEISGESPERCFEFKLESLLSKEQKIENGNFDDEEFLENAKYFYLFFGKPSYVKDKTGKIFLDEVLKQSRKYIDSIEEDLKDRFISAMNYMCDGLLRVAKENGTISKPNKEDLSLIRTVAESHLFNILFIKSCEARGVLPTKAPDYYRISLTSIIDRIRVFDPEKYTKSRDKDYINQRLKKSLKVLNFNLKGNNLYKNLIKLTEVVHEGTDKHSYGFEVKGFKESIFSKKEWSFAKKHQLTDEDMVQILFQLGYSKSEKSLQRNYQQIPYNYFTARQLGSIYESFLDYQLDIAVDPMVYYQSGKYRQWTKLTAAMQKKLKGFEPVVNKGQLFFTPDNSERRATGSYYTPDYIVQYMVNATIEPLCKNKNSEELLSLKICDPAMGSGHFLIGALNFLTRRYLQALEQEKSLEEIPSSAEAKRIVLDRCIFGIDINSRAVKLAKMSLWLESAHPGKKLERLDDQLITSNSILDSKIWASYEELNAGGFDAVIGNPPYSRLQSQNDRDAVYISKLKKVFESTQSGSFDLYIPFVEKGCNFLSGSGRLSYILPNTVLTVKYAEKLRDLICKDKMLEEVVSFNEFKVFNNASTYTCILTLSKEANKSFTYKELSDAKLYKEISKTPEDLNKSSLFSKSSINHPQDGSDWKLKSGDFEDIFAKVDSAADKSMKDVSKKIFQGLITGCDKVFISELIAEDDTYFTVKTKLSGQIKLEKGICRRVFMGKNVHRYSMSKSEKILIFPYIRCENSNWNLIGAKLFKKTFPSAYKYCLEHRDVLGVREKGKFKGDEFYQFSRPQSLNFLSEPKLVMRSFSCRGEVTIDKIGDSLFTPNVYGVNFEKTNFKSMLYYMSYLNSNLVWFFIKMTSSVIGSGYYQYTSRYTSKLPVISFEVMKKKYPKDLEKIISLADLLIKKEDVDSKIDLELDSIFYRLYNLTQEEINTIDSHRHSSR